MRCLTVSLLILFAAAATAQPQMRPIEELTTDSAGWTDLMSRVKTATNKIEILPADQSAAQKALFNTQVTTASMLGAVVYKTGGILVDGGWIRILGSGNEKLKRSLPEWNKGKTFSNYGEPPSYVLIADDVVGGFFALNGGGLGPETNKIYYLSPDELKWEPLHITYSEFIDFCMVGDMNLFYDGLRWKDWQKDLANVSGVQAFFIYPYPWTKEGKDINKDSRKVVPVEEVYKLETGFLTKHK